MNHEGHEEHEGPRCGNSLKKCFLFVSFVSFVVKKEKNG